MHVISQKQLKDFWEQKSNRDSEMQLRAWYKEAKNAIWKSSADVKSMYRSASIIDHKRVVFNIAGNKYRLVVWINYQFGRINIRWIGTHKAYDNVNVGEL
jgi:mRNA interferase HigB